MKLKYIFRFFLRVVIPFMAAQGKRLPAVSSNRKIIRLQSQSVIIW
jgi:hypothetical protein